MWRLDALPPSVAHRHVFLCWIVIVSLFALTVTGAGTVSAERATQGGAAGIPIGYRYAGPGEPDAPPLFSYSYHISPQETVRYPHDPAFSVSGTPGITDGCAHDGTVHVSRYWISVGSCFVLEMPRVELDDWALYVAWGEGSGPWLFGGTIVEAIAWDWDTNAWAAATVVFDQAGTFHVHTASSDAAVMDSVDATVMTATGWWGVTLDQAPEQPEMAGGVLDPLGALEAWGDFAPVDTPDGPWVGVWLVLGEGSDGTYYAPRPFVGARVGPLFPCENVPALVCEDHVVGGPAVPVPQSIPVDTSPLPSGGTTMSVRMQSAEVGDEVFPVYRRTQSGDLGFGTSPPVAVCTRGPEIWTECVWLN